MNSARVLATFKILCPSGSDEGAESFLRDFYLTVPLSVGLSIRILFWIFNWLPLFIVFRFKTAVHLEEMDRERYLEWWTNNRFYFIREILNSLKTISLLARLGKDWELP